MHLLLKNKFVFIFWLCIAVSFGLSFLLTPVLQQNADASLQFARFPLGVLIFVVLTFALLYISRRDFKDGTKSSRLSFLTCFSAISAVCIVYLLVFYPGTGMYDTLGIVRSHGFGVARQHPWFYVALVQVIRRIVFVCGGGYEATLVVLSLVQIFLAAAVYSYCLIWLQEKKLNRKIYLLIALFYIFCPFLSLMAINIFKDIPFSLLMLAWMPLLYDFWESHGAILKEKRTLSTMSFCIVLSLLRNNGIYASAFMLVPMLIVSEHRRQVIILILVLICTIAGSNLFEKLFKVTHLFKETVGIPLNQVAGVIYYDGEISEKDKQFINKIIPLDFIKEKYSPYTVDRLKWGGAPLDNKFLNSHRRTFLKTWARLAIPNFKIYVNVYLRNTYGFWALDTSLRNSAHTSIYVKAFDKWLKEKNVAIKTLLPSGIQETVEPILKKSTRFIGEGMAFWLFVLLWIVFGIKNGAYSLIVGAPIIANWLTIMMATPVSRSFRYVLCIPMAIPLMVGLLLLKRGDDNG